MKGRNSEASRKSKQALRFAENVDDGAREKLIYPDRADSPGRDQATNESINDGEAVEEGNYNDRTDLISMI